MRRLLNLPKTNNATNKPGLVMIQIDGLGFTQFERAIKNGNMPFLDRLLKKECYVNRRHYTGLPSNTPAVQGALFYGVPSCVPAFSFKDHVSGKIFNMFNPECASAVEQHIKDRGEPLLKDGSAYGNIFTGGAKEAHFCAASVGWGSLVTAIHPLGASLAVLLNVHIVFRSLFLILVEFFLAVSGSVRGVLFQKKKFMSELGFIPLRVAVCVLLRDVIAAGARIDIKRGLPVIHINLAGYDEQAHHRGPTSAFAHWSLRGIDSAISKIWKAAQKSQRRDYDVFVYSDHGQEETVSYQDEYGRSVDDAINLVLAEKVAERKWQIEFNRAAPYGRAHLLRNKPGKTPETSEPGKTDIPLRAVVAAMGNVGHIYPPEKLSTEEAGMIASQLVDLARIPIVMIPSGPGKATAWTSDGRFILPEEADKVMDAQHPFFKEVVRDLVGLCHHPDAGEILIFGWRKGAKSLSFHTEHGSHAGPGSRETSGFALLPKGALPRSFKETICTQDLRDAAFRAQGIGNRKASAPSESAGSASGHPTLRMMTYNVHGCMGRDGKISPYRIAGIIARHDPDVIALQELSTSDQAHQAQIIAQQLDMTFHYHSSFSIKKGQRGNAIISRFPIRLVKNGSLPKLPRHLFLEPRGALWVEIDVYGQKVQVVNTHLSLSPVEGLLQMKALCGPDWMANPDCNGLVVFCGDLNALSNSKICKHLGQTLKNTHTELKGHRPLKTLPSYYPLGLVDHIFVGAGLQTTQIEVPKSQIEKISSDHLPLIVDLQVA